MTRRRPVRTPASQSPRLVGYVRVSTDDQAREGVSLGAQRDRLAAYCTAHGVELVAIEADEAISGKVAPADRPGLAAALERVRAGKADGLLVLKLDRLSRSTRDVLDLVDETRRGAWRLVSVSEHLDTGTAAGRLVVTVLAALSEMEREQTAERTRFALDAIAREGRARSYRTPFGWHTAGGSDRQAAGDRRPLVEHELEQRIRGRIVRMRRRGFGARRIARALNHSRTPNPRTGGVWAPSTVAALLRTLERRAAALAA